MDHDPYLMLRITNQPNEIPYAGALVTLHHLNFKFKSKCIAIERKLF